MGTNRKWDIFGNFQTLWIRIFFCIFRLFRSKSFMENQFCFLKTEMWFYVCHFSTLRCLVFKGGSKKNCWMCENLKSLWPEDSSSSFKVKQSMTRRQIFSFVLYLHSGKLCYMGKISRENPLENGSHEKMRRHAQFHTSFMLQNPSLRMRPSELFFQDLWIVLGKLDFLVVSKVP